MEGNSFSVSFLKLTIRESQSNSNTALLNLVKIWSSHLLDNLSNCLMNLKNSGDSTGFEPMTCAMPVQCSNQLSYEVTQLRAGQFVGLMFSRERNVVWKKCCMKCGIWNQVKIWSSHLLDNLSNCLMNLKNSGDSTGFEPMTSAMPVQCSNQLSYEVTQLRAGQTNWSALKLLKLSSKCEDHIFTWFQIPHFMQHFFHTTFLSRENMSPTNWPGLI